jgi:hypothetical protein
MVTEYETLASVIKQKKEQRERTQVGARRAKPKVGHSGTYEQTDYLTSCCTTSSP